MLAPRRIFDTIFLITYRSVERKNCECIQLLGREEMKSNIILYIYYIFTKIRNMYIIYKNFSVFLR
jgi:hypothetical protein